jgi:hypothetical protein
MANGEQDQAAKHAETQRRAAAGQAQANAPANVPVAQPPQQQVAAQKTEADQRNREELERSREERANRPPDMAFGGKPTPTQAENDEIRMGLRHIDDKEPSGSPPDFGDAYDEFRSKFNQERNKAGSKNR